MVWWAGQGGAGRGKAGQGGAGEPVHGHPVMCGQGRAVQVAGGCPGQAATKRCW